MTREDLSQDILKTTLNLLRFSLDLGTGVGKTGILLQHMKRDYHEGISFLVVIPRNSLINNWKKEAVKRDCEFLLKHITFVTYRSLHLVKLDYDAIYFDEAHNLNKNHHYQAIETLPSNIKMIAVTGTYFSEEEMYYERFTDLFPLVYTFGITDAIKAGWLNDFRILIHWVPLSNSIRVKSFGGKYETEVQAYRNINAALNRAEKKCEYGKLQRLRIVRMKLLQGFRSKELYAKEMMKYFQKKAIIFCESTKQADTLCQHSYHSKNKKGISEKNLELFSSGEIKKLSAVGQLNEGTNIPDLVNIGILHSYSNKKKSSQRIGRGLRLAPDSGEIAYIHILVYQNTIDADWCRNALSDFEKEKIGIIGQTLSQKLQRAANLIQ